LAGTGKLWRLLDINIRGLCMNTLRINMRPPQAHLYYFILFTRRCCRIKLFEASAVLQALLLGVGNY
jgi:hypothetical protein